MPTMQLNNSFRFRTGDSVSLCFLSRPCHISIEHLQIDLKYLGILSQANHSVREAYWFQFLGTNTNIVEMIDL